MKKHTLLSDIAVFLLIIFLFIVPPFFASVPADGSSLFADWSFPWRPLLLAIFSFVLLFFYYDFRKDDDSASSALALQKGGIFAVWPKLKIFPVIFTFGMLFSCSLFIQYFGLAFGLVSSGVSFNHPQGLFQWLFCILNFLSAAFYEEVLYRFYFTDELKNLLGRRFNWKWLGWACEMTGLLCFAFAHLYMGWLSVINAAFAHIFLRLCYKKTGKIWPCFASHFIYNIFSLILL
jgi:membrane protease YdiL (CAAX protease family)